MRLHVWSMGTLVYMYLEDLPFKTFHIESFIYTFNYNTARRIFSYVHLKLPPTLSYLDPNDLDISIKSGLSLHSCHIYLFLQVIT